MVDSESWGITWMGNDRVNITKISTNTRKGLTSTKIQSSHDSKTVKMDKDRFEYEKNRVENNRSFSTSFSQDKYYRRIDGENYSHPIEEYGEFESKLDDAQSLQRMIPEDVSIDDIMRSDHLNRSFIKRAKNIIENSSDDSIDFSTIAMAEHLNDPILHHIDSNDLKTILYNRKKGVFIGEDKNSPEEKKEPTGRYYSYAVLTNKAINLLIGQRSEDSKIEVPYRKITEVETSTGWTKYRLSIGTKAETYHFWVNPSSGRDTLKDSKKYIEEKARI